MCKQHATFMQRMCYSQQAPAACTVVIFADSKVTSISETGVNSIVTSATAKIGALSTRQACTRCCCFVVGSWHRPAFHQQVPYTWSGCILRRHLQTSWGMSTSQPSHNTGASKGTTAGLSGHVAAVWGRSGSFDVSLPTDKLAASRRHDVDQRPVVLVNCGSFNPPTIMHLRMFDVAAQVLRKASTLAHCIATQSNHNSQGS